MTRRGKDKGIPWKRSKSFSSRASSGFDTEEAEASENYVAISDDM